MKGNFLSGGQWRGLSNLLPNSTRRVKLREPDRGLFDVPCLLQLSCEHADFLRVLGSEILSFVRIGFNVEELRIAVVHRMYEGISIWRAIVAENELPLAIDAPAILQ